ncbi:MAG: thioredoxin family protein [Deltaproteobacteria bacterium]|nr:thioredoxin family protein [Deltaproteobacteria bacterium]
MQENLTPSEATPAEGRAPGGIPVKGMPTLLDLGADQCMPCKMMVPVLETVEKKYKGRAGHGPGRPDGTKVKVIGPDDVMAELHPVL